MLQEGRIKEEEWNNNILPAIEKGILKERKDLVSDGFLMVYQLFSSVIEDTDGKLYHCSGWASESTEPHVEVTEISPRSSNGYRA